MDSNIFTDPPYAKEFFKALIPLQIKWDAGCSLDIVKDKEALKLLRDSGCFGLGFGYEIFGTSPEKIQGGKMAMATKYIEYTKLLKKNKLMVKGSFIVGWDSDTYTSFLKLWKFCLRIHPWVTSFSMLTPIPGSKLYNDLFKENRIINLNWRQYAMNHLVFSHPKMKPALINFLFPLFSYTIFFSSSLFGQLLLIIVLSVIGLSILFGI